MHANPAARDGFASADYTHRNPFARVQAICMMEGLRPGVRIPEAERLGHLCVDPSGRHEMEVELPYAYHEMLERAGQLVVRTIDVAQFGITRSVYVVVAADEADEKLVAFSAWANGILGFRPECIRGYPFWPEFTGDDTLRIIGWWALGYQTAWTLSAGMAEELRRAFQPV